MRISLHPYKLQFKYPFKIAHGVRTYTDVVYVKIEHTGFTGWGEATLPPYLPETQQSVTEFINAFAVGLSNDSPDEWAEKLLQDTSGNSAAKAGLDMALWDIKAQMASVTVKDLLAINVNSFPLGTYTIGVSSAGELKEKVTAATQAGFKLFKLKLTGENDEEVVTSFRALTDTPFAVDVNQGWIDVKEAISKAKFLKKQGCVFIEQPFNKDALAESKELKKANILPVYADESCQNLSDIDRLKDSFDGINIKLMKCGGITQARKMITLAREFKLKVLIGCMSESSVGCTAAAQLTPLADYADLDGPYLIANDPFEGMKVENGKVVVYPLVTKIQLEH